METAIKPTTGALITGAAIGGATAVASKQVAGTFGFSILNKMKRISANLTADEFKAITTAMDMSMQRTGLGQNGWKILKATEENLPKIKKTIMDEFGKHLLTKFNPQIKKEMAANLLTMVLNNGDNAFTLFKTKKILMPAKDLALAFFHEAGHAMNSQFSTFGKILQKCRPLTLLALPIALVGLIKSPKANGEKPKGFWDKTTTFIKNHAGKLAFLTAIPTIAEEALASMKGNNLAKQLLSPELAKKVAKSNVLGLATYTILAALTGFGIYLGVKVRDNILSQQNNKA